MQLKNRISHFLPEPDEPLMPGPDMRTSYEPPCGIPDSPTGYGGLDDLQACVRANSKGEALLADNLAPLEPRGPRMTPELAPPPGTLTLLTLVVGSTVLWVVARELVNWWR